MFYCKIFYCQTIFITMQIEIFICQCITDNGWVKKYFFSNKVHILLQYANFVPTLVLGDLVRTVQEWNEDSSCVGTTGWGLQHQLICYDALTMCFRMRVAFSCFNLQLSCRQLNRHLHQIPMKRCSVFSPLLWMWRGRLLGTLQDEKQDLSKVWSHSRNHYHLV